MDKHLGSAKLLGSSLILSMTSESWLLSRVAGGDVGGGGVSALVSVMWWPVLVPGPTYISLRLHHETITLLHNLMLTKTPRTQRHVHRQIQTPQPHNKQENPRPLTWWTSGQHLYNRESRAHRAVCQFAMHCIIGMQKQWIMFAPTNPSLQIGIGCSFMGCFSVKCYCLSPT